MIGGCPVGGYPLFLFLFPTDVYFMHTKNTLSVSGAGKKLPAGTKHALYVPGITTAGTYTWWNMPNCRKKLPVGTNRTLYVPPGAAIGTNTW